MFREMFQGTNNEKITKYTAWAIFLLAIFLLVQIFIGLKKFGYIGKEIYPQRTIAVMGEGKSFAIPDIATFSFTVTEAGESVEGAQGLLDKKIEGAVNILHELNVEDKDIKTSSYNVYPKYQWEQVYCAQVVGVICPPGNNVLVGYEVSETIVVKIRETLKAGDLVNRTRTL